MEVAVGRIARLAVFAHHNLLWLLAGAYVLAVLAPWPGLWLRSVNLTASLPGDLPRVSLPAILLSFLLFNAGLGTQAWA